MDMYLGIATKMLVGSIGVFAVLRIMGKKTMSELTPFDLLYILILGSLIEESIYDDQVNIFHVLFAIVLWGVTVYFIEKILQHTEKFSTLIQGEPSVLIDKGRLNIKELRANHFDMEQLRTMLRENGCYSIDDAYHVILEVSGGFTVITKEEMKLPTYLLMENGSIKQNTLEEIGKNKQWLEESLNEMGYPDLNEILYCEWDAREEKINVGTYKEAIDEKIYIDD